MKVSAGRFGLVCAALVPLLGGALSACKRAAPPAAVREDRVVVFAAEPLRDAFSTMLGDFQWSKPGLEVQLTFGDAHELGTKIEQGATFDVIAACDDNELGALERGRRVEAPVVIARDEAIVIVPGARGTKVKTFADLSEPVRQRVLSVAGAHGRDGAATAEKVAAGEAEAALVSRTVLRALKDRVGAVPLPPGTSEPTTCALALAAAPAHPGAARAWSDFVRSSTGQQTLRDAGFLPAL